MKLYLQILSILVFISINHYTQTIIPPGDVCGNWTVISSPYLVNGDITIPTDSVLIIEPGVMVEFQGHYKFNVQGQLLAVGTETDSITFTINDTTGFSNPNVPNGGWFGIRFFVTPYHNDTSKIIYCKLQWGKAIGDIPGIQHADNLGGAVFISYFDKVIISNCLIINNFASKAGGGIAIVHCNPKISDNTVSYNKAEYGGGIELREESNPKIVNNVIVNNKATYGGGIDCLGVTNPGISNTVIKNNASDDVGGGIACFFSGITLNNVTLTENKAGTVGGGIGTWRSNLMIDSSTINNNEASESGSGVFFNCGDTLILTYQLNITNSDFTSNKTIISDAALNVQQSDSARIYVIVSKCLFKENFAPYISAVRFEGKYLNFNFNHNIISNNEAISRSSGVMFTRCKGKVSNCLFNSNKVDTVGEFYNFGSVAVWEGAEVDFMHNTFVDNSASYGAGLFVGYGGSAVVINSIFWGNSESQIALYTHNDKGGTLSINHCNIQGGKSTINILDSLSILNWGINNMDENPLFVDQINGDYHLQNISPCLGKAIDTIVINGVTHYCPYNDIEDCARPNPVGTMPDIGAYESPFANPVEVEQESDNILNEYYLAQNFPNPFNPFTKLSYSIAQSDLVTLKVFDILGNEIETLVNEVKPIGTYELTWNAESLPSGIYLYRIQSGSFIDTRKMILLK